MSFFVNLPLSWIYRDPLWLDLFFRRGARLRFWPELGFDAESLGLPLTWHKETAAKIKDRGLRAAVHLPFFMPLPGAECPAERARGRKALLKAAELANMVYGAAHLIGHPDFDRAPVFTAPPSEIWLERSASIWGEVMRAGPAPLFLENTYENGPTAIIALLARLRADFGPTAAFCFDIGHWFSFAAGSRLDNLGDWLRAVRPWLAHLHLHDNDGKQDQHHGLGRGGIPLDRLFAGLAELRLYPSYTLEPHSKEALGESLAWAGQSREMRAWLARAGRPA